MMEDKKTAQQTVAEAKQNAELQDLYSKRSTMDILRMMSDLKRRKEELEEKLSHVNLHYDYLRYVTVPARFDAEDIKNMKIEGIGRVQLQSGVYASVNKERVSDAYEFLRDTGRGDIIKDTINAMTLAATVKSMIEKGEEIPEELFVVTPWTRASIVKA